MMGRRSWSLVQKRVLKQRTAAKTGQEGRQPVAQGGACVGSKDAFRTVRPGFVSHPLHLSTTSVTEQGLGAKAL